MNDEKLIVDDFFKDIRELEKIIDNQETLTPPET